MIPPPAPTALTQALDLLAQRLRSLDATGPHGFEGLLADLFGEVTGQSFLRAKSGTQGGADLRTLTNQLEIGVEAKRYEPGTSLPLDQLQSKLVDAAQQADPVDIWVLAATRAISGTDQQALIATGQTHGLKVLVLDWPVSGLPRMAVLCGLAPNAMARRFAGDAALAAALATIAADDRYVAMATALKAELLAGDVGLAAAAAVVNEWSRQAQRSELAARQRLDGFNNLLEGDRVADRPALRAQLDAWWASGPGLAALLGDEGHGKTWTSLAWWDRMAAEPQTQPLLLFVSAREMETGDLHGVVARLLLNRTGMRDEVFWTARLRQWRRTAHPIPRLLLVVDGLNQRWLRRDWADTLQPLFDAEAWGGLCSVIVTCRPDHWRLGLDDLRGLAPAPTPITVPPFDDAELDALLALHGLGRKDFAFKVLELMKVPRLSLLAIERQAALAQSGDVTDDRLAYEDWKSRATRSGRGVGVVTDAEFKSLLADLGRQIQSQGPGYALTRSALTTALSRDSGRPADELGGAVSDLVDGGWLEPGHQPHHFRVKPQRTAFALGVYLVHDLKAQADGDDLGERIASFLDPLKGQDLGVSILRAAATVALIDETVGRPIRQAIFQRWLSEQNVGPVDFEALWRLVGLDPDLFLDLVDSAWGRPPQRFLDDEILSKACANAYQFERFAPALRARLTLWLGRAWRVAASAGPPPEGVTLVDHDLTRGQTRVAGLLSWLPRARMGPALRAWALSRAFMGRSDQFDDLAWVLRENRKDAGEAAPVLSAVIESLSREGGLGGLAAGLLAAASGRVEHAALAVSVSRAAPLVRGLVEPPRPYDPAAAALDPDRPLDNDAVDEETALNVFSAPLDGRPGVQPDRVILARADPGLLAHQIRAAALRGPTLSTLDLIELAGHLPAHSLVLSEIDRAGLEALLDERAAQASIDEAQALKAALLALRLWGRSALLQADILDRHLNAGGAAPSEAVIDLFETFEVEEVAQVLDRITPDRSTIALESWLGVLRDKAPRAPLNDWPALARLLDHPDRNVRLLALKFSANTQNLAARTHLASSAWRADGVTDADEQAFGSWILVDALAPAGGGAWRERIDPQAYSVWLQRFPDDPAALSLFGGLVRAVMEESTQPAGTRSYPRFWNDHGPGLAVLVDKDPNFVAFVEAYCADWTKVRWIDFMESFPMISLTKVLLEKNADLGVTLWRCLRDEINNGIVTREELPWMPFGKTGQGQTLAAARAEALDAAVADRQIFDLARQAARGKAAPALAALVREDLVAEASPGRLARAATVLGFMLAQDRDPRDWEILTALTPTGWLRRVRETAWAASERDRHARIWFERFLDAIDDAEAFAAFELFLVAADGRAGTWMWSMMRARPDLCRGRGAHVRANRERLGARFKTVRDDLRNRLYATPVGGRGQALWG